MGRFSAAAMFGALDAKFQKVYNYLLELLDSGYTASAVVGGKKVDVALSPQKGLEIAIDGVKAIYTSSAGVLVTSQYDVNEDGIVDQQDIDLITEYIAHGTGYLPRMDVNGDGNVNSIDLSLVYNHSVFTNANPPPSLPIGLDNVSYIKEETTPVTDGANWYRISYQNSEPGEGNVTNNSGRFEIRWTGSGIEGFAAFYAANMYNTATTIKLAQLIFSAVGAGITKARIVYKTDDSEGECTFLELYHSSATEIAITVRAFDRYGWEQVYVDPVPSSIPSGYTSEELVFS